MIQDDLKQSFYISGCLNTYIITLKSILSYSAQFNQNRWLQLIILKIPIECYKYIFQNEITSLFVNDYPSANRMRNKL